MADRNMTIYPEKKSGHREKQEKERKRDYKGWKIQNLKLKTRGRPSGTRIICYPRKA